MSRFASAARLLALCACAAAVAAVPSRASAQCIMPPGQNATQPCPDQSPPEVTVSPTAGQVSQPGLPVLVSWWDESANTVVDRITLNGVDVRGAFEVTRDTSTTYLPDVQGPVLIETGTARGTVQLAAGQTNVLEVRICDSGGRCSPPASRQFTIGAPGVRVTPDGDPVAVPAGSTNTAWFRVHNTGSAAATFSLAAECRYENGQHVTPCSVSSSSVTVGAGDSVNVTATFPTAQPGGGTVHVLLRAQQSGQPGIQDAGWIDFVVYGATGTSLVAPIAVLAPLNQADVQERGQCITLSAAPRGAYECGDLRVVHALPATHSRGRTRAPVLLYNSQHAHPRPVVYADVTVPANAARPNAVEMVVSLAGGVVHRATFAGTDFVPGMTRRLGVQWDGLQTPTGLYRYTVQVISHYDGVSRATDGLTGEISIVNRSTSYFGAGWWLAGLERIYCIDCGSGGSRTLWVGGDGSTRVFEPVVPGGWSTWTARNPDGAPDTLVLLSGGTYVRKLNGGGEIHYDGGGRHVKTANRLGQTTQFAYNGTGLAAIYAPGAGPGGPGTGDPAWTMNWDNAALLVRSITATVQGAAARTTQLAIDGSGRVTGITDPDGLGVGFGYDAAFTRRIVRQRDRRGTDVHYTYGAAGKLASARLQMGPTANPAVDPQTGYAPEEAQGVAMAGATGATSVAAMLAYTRIDGPRADVADHTRLWMSRAGAVRRVRDALGAETFVQHDARFPALATRVTGPTGLVSRAHYDAFGRVDTATVENPLGDGRNQVTLYQYDNRWHLPTWVRGYSVSGGTWTPLSGAARAAYDSLTGNVLWKQQGDDIARRTTFTYHTSGAAAGQLHTVAYPLDAQGQAATDTLTYDGRGNLRRVRSPTGMLTLVVRDSLGRDTLTISPLDESQARSETGLRASGIRQRTEYDGMDRPTVTETIGPAIQQRQSTDLSWTYKPADTPEERLRVQTVYDGEGLATQVIRQMTPDPGAIGNVQTLYEYDAAGRRWMESGSQGAPKTSTFDLAGNVVEVRVGTRLAATMQYDAANRLVRRTVPAVTHAVRYDQLALLQHVAPIPFPRFPNAANGALLIPEEHSYYRYDAAGNQVYAENADAIIRRGYFANGALRSDTLQLRNYETAGYDQGYGLEYAYDLAGRVVSMSHPQNLAAAPNHRDQYGYDPTTGALAHATGRLGHVFQFQHDNLGRPTVTFMPGGVQDSVGYDGEGRPAWHRVRGPQTSGYLLDETMQYDGRGKLLRASNGASVYQQWYSGMGNLVATDWQAVNSMSRSVEEYRTDPLGNVVRSQRGDGTTVIGATGNHPRYNAYEPGQGRVVGMAKVRPAAVGPDFQQDSTAQSFDASGNLSRAYSVTAGRESEAWHFYGADDRLRVVQRVAVTNSGDNYGLRFSGVWEEYRYDPLGRRVMVRTRTDGGLCDVDPWTCTGSITRYVWAGDQVLWELKAPGNEGADLEATTASGAAFGQVSYLHAGGIDRPLVITKGGASEIPHQNWRGLFAIATSPDGARSPTQVDWPGFHTTPWHGATRVVENWMGSLSVGQRDASGQMYMRNRYYDPRSGQFTQPDPIGLAGGLNSYGFAQGDPVTYSDPYGLKIYCDAESKVGNRSGCDLYEDLRTRVNAGLRSDDRTVRAGARRLARMLNEMDADENRHYVVTAAVLSDDSGGGEENPIAGRAGWWAATIDPSQDPNNPNQQVSASPWILVAHELGGARARSLGNSHASGSIPAENGARMIAGCRKRWGHGGDTFITNPGCYR